MKQMVSFFAALLLSVSIMGAAFADNTISPENLEFSTQAGKAYSGQLIAADTEGGNLSFYITTGPRKGNIALLPNGRFLYVPGEGRHGWDYFGYKVSDGAGNTSQEATVIIRIEK